MFLHGKSLLYINLSIYLKIQVRLASKWLILGNLNGPTMDSEATDTMKSERIPEKLPKKRESDLIQRVKI